MAENDKMEKDAKMEKTTFRVEWELASYTSGNKDAKDDLTILTAMPEDRMWGAVLNGLATLYYSVDGWREDSELAIPKPWRTPAIERMFNHLANKGFPDPPEPQGICRAETMPALTNLTNVTAPMDCTQQSPPRPSTPALTTINNPLYERRREAEGPPGSPEAIPRRPTTTDITKAPPGYDRGVANLDGAHSPPEDASDSDSSSGSSSSTVESLDHRRSKRRLEPLLGFNLAHSSREVGHRETSCWALRRVVDEAKEKFGKDAKRRKEDDE